MVKGAQSRTANGQQTAQPSSVAGPANGIVAPPDAAARASTPDGAASQRLPVGEGDAVSGASVLTGEPVHLYVMGDRSVRCPDHAVVADACNACSADAAVRLRQQRATLCPAGSSPPFV